MGCLLLELIVIQLSSMHKFSLPQNNVFLFRTFRLKDQSGRLHDGESRVNDMEQRENASIF